MREIIFRGQREDNCEWIYGAYYHQTEFYGDDCDYHYIISSCDELEDNMMCFDGVIPETVGQYTGLTDKNGKKVFEGDILVFCKGSTYPYKIILDGMGWKLIRSDGKRIKEAFECNEIHYVGISEVIGNIHDNPELLEVK